MKTIKFFTVALFAFALSMSHAEAKKCVEVNKATAKELQTLKGVGPAVAKAIVNYRKAARSKATKTKKTAFNYNNWASLMKVKGVAATICKDNVNNVCFNGKLQKNCPALKAKKRADKKIKKTKKTADKAVKKNVKKAPKKAKKIKAKAKKALKKAA